MQVDLIEVVVQRALRMRNIALDTASRRVSLISRAAMLLAILLLLLMPSLAMVIRQGAPRLPRIVAPPDPVLDCSLRSLLHTAAVDRLTTWPPSSNYSSRIFDALRLDECPQVTFGARPRPTTSSSPILAPADIFVSSETGDDNADGATSLAPVRTLYAAQARVRDLRLRGASARLIVQLNGTFSLRETLVLNETGDSGTTWRGPAIISGGIPLKDLIWRPSATFAPPVLDAILPPGTPTSGVYSMFDGDSGRRLPLAREPNGDVETMLQPIGWALARGNLNGSLTPPGQYAHIEVDTARNSSVFPVWGRDYDPRNAPIGYVWYGENGGVPSLFEGNRSFWANKTIPGGLRWNATGGVDPHSGLPASGFNGSHWARYSPGRRAHIFHNALWGGWVYNVDAVDAASQTMTFSSGGWQEGRGGGMGTQPFYVEGAPESLDAPSEWWINATAGVLSHWPNSTSVGAPRLLVVPVLETLVTVGASAPAVEFTDITFMHTTDGLMSTYTVSSPGDWSVRRSAAVVVDGANGTSLRRCSWQRVNTNGLLVTGAARDTVVDEADFYKPGGNAVAVIGYLPRANGSDPAAAFPINVTITRTLVEGVGVYGKQTSALFVSLACNVILRDSVLFSGPRAGVNINDGFCGGHALEGNVIFDWVRETQDHGESIRVHTKASGEQLLCVMMHGATFFIIGFVGPINTWDRSLYVWADGSLAAGWVRITGNAILNGPSGNRDLGNLFPTVDNDDGSQRYWIASNVLIYGGGKYVGTQCASATHLHAPYTRQQRCPDRLQKLPWPRQGLGL